MPQPTDVYLSTSTRIPEPSVDQLVQDPEFFTLPEASQASILKDADADFASLPASAQRSILQDFRRQHAPTTGERVQSGLETFAPPVAATAAGVLTAPMGPQVAVPAAMGAAALTRGATEFTRPLLTDQSLRDPGEMARNAAVSGVEAGTGELLGTGAVKGVEGASRAFAGRITPEVAGLQGQLRSVGKTFSAGQLTDAPMLQVIESAVESSLIGGRGLAAMKADASEEGVRRLAERLVQDVGTKLEPSMVAKLVTNSREVGIEAFNSAKRTLYREVDDAARGVILDTSSVLSRIRAPQQNRYIDRAVASADAGMDLKIEDLLTRPKVTVGGMTPGGQSVNRVTTITDTAQFSAAQEARSRLLRVARRLKTATTADDQAIGETAGRLAADIDRAMEGAATRLNPDALQKFRTANAFTREGMERFNNQLIRSVVKKLEKEPGHLDDVLFQANSVDTWKTLRAAVDAGTMERLSQRMAVKLVDASQDVNGLVNGATLLGRLNGLGDETVRQMFPQTGAKLAEFARTAHSIQGMRGERTGQVVMKIAQASAAVGAFSFQFTGAGAAIIVTPVVLGRILSDPRGIKLLTEGFKAGAKSETFFRAMSQLAVTFTPRSLKERVGDLVPVGAERSSTVAP